MTFKNLQRPLRGFVRRGPFRPFVLEFMTGETHPESVHINGELFVYMSSNLQYRVVDCNSVHQLRDVAE